MADLFDTYGLKDAPKPVGAAMSVNNPPIPPQFRTPPVAGASAMPGRQWSDVPGEALSNLGSSAGEFVSNLVQPILHPVDTAQGMWDIAKGLASKASQPAAPRFRDRSPEYMEHRAKVEAPADAVGQFFADRYGSVEGLKNTLATDPVGAVGDAATVLTGGGAATMRAPGLVRQAGRAVSKAGAILDPVSAVGNLAKGTGKLAETLASNVLGGTTGAGARDVRAAANAGFEGGEKATAFLENLRGGDTSLGTTIDMAKSAVDKLRQERSDAYKAGKVDLSKDKTVLDFTSIEDAVGKANEVGSYKGVVVNRKAGGAVDEINSIVSEWKKLDPAEYHTPEGLDALKRSIGDLRDSTEYGTPARVAADRVYNAVKAEVSKQAPAYSKMMEDYANASEQLKDVTKTFSLKEGTSADTAQRKLQSASRNNVQANYGERTKLLDVLAAHEPNLPAALAGQNLNALAPRGLVAKLLGGGGAAAATLTNPLALLTAPAFSPRVVGEAAYYGGKAAGGIDSLAEALAINAPNVRTAGQGAFQAGRAGNEAENRALAIALRQAAERRAVGR